MCKLFIWRQHRPQSIQRVGFGGGFVGAPAEDAGEADGDAGFVAVRAVQTLEAKKLSVVYPKSSPVRC